MEIGIEGNLGGMKGRTWRAGGRDKIRLLLLIAIQLPGRRGGGQVQKPKKGEALVQITFSVDLSTLVQVVCMILKIRVHPPFPSKKDILHLVI
jgi:hypothetical protein